MPTLPTFTVTQPTADRLLAAFDGQMDEAGQPLTPTQAYKRWLKQNLVGYVTNFEAHQEQTVLEDELQ